MVSEDQLNVALRIQLLGFLCCTLLPALLSTNIPEEPFGTGANTVLANVMCELLVSIYIYKHI